MADQLAFDLPSVPALGRDDFFVAASNQLAFAATNASGDWPEGRMLLIGPIGCGKTHLVHVWAAGCNAEIADAGNLVESVAGWIEVPPPALAIEDIDRIAGHHPAEEALFHLLNARRAGAQPLLLTSTLPPTEAGFVLPDIQSRLSGTASAPMGPPDDALLTAVMVKQFRDRQLNVAPSLITYILRRCERSFSGVQKLVAGLDQAALERGAAPNRTLAREVLDKLGLDDA